MAFNVTIYSCILYRNVSTLFSKHHLECIRNYMVNSLYNKYESALKQRIFEKVSLITFLVFFFFFFLFGLNESSFFFFFFFNINKKKKKGLTSQYIYILSLAKQSENSDYIKYSFLVLHMYYTLSSSIIIFGYLICFLLPLDFFRDKKYIFPPLSCIRLLLTSFSVILGTLNKIVYIYIYKYGLETKEEKFNTMKMMLIL